MSSIYRLLERRQFSNFLFPNRNNRVIYPLEFFTKIFRRISMLLFFFGSVGTILNIFQNFKFLNLFENFIVILIISIFVLLSIVCEYVTRIYFQLKKTERIIYEKKINF